MEKASKSKTVLLVLAMLILSGFIFYEAKAEDVAITVSSVVYGDGNKTVYYSDGSTDIVFPMPTVKNGNDYEYSDLTITVDGSAKTISNSWYEAILSTGNTLDFNGIDISVDKLVVGETVHYPDNSVVVDDGYMDIYHGIDMSYVYDDNGVENTYTINVPVDGQLCNYSFFENVSVSGFDVYVRYDKTDKDFDTKDPILLINKTNVYDQYVLSVPRVFDVNHEMECYVYGKFYGNILNLETIVSETFINNCTFPFYLDPRINIVGQLDNSTWTSSNEYHVTGYCSLKNISNLWIDPDTQIFFDTTNSFINCFPTSSHIWANGTNGHPIVIRRNNTGVSRYNVFILRSSYNRFSYVNVTEGNTVFYLHQDYNIIKNCDILQCTRPVYNGINAEMNYIANNSFRGTNNQQDFVIETTQAKILFLNNFCSYGNYAIYESGGTTNTKSYFLNNTINVFYRPYYGVALGLNRTTYFENNTVYQLREDFFFATLFQSDFYIKNNIIFNPIAAIPYPIEMTAKVGWSEIYIFNNTFYNLTGSYAMNGGIYLSDFSIVNVSQNYFVNSTCSNKYLMKGGVPYGKAWHNYYHSHSNIDGNGDGYADSSYIGTLWNDSQPLVSPYNPVNVFDYNSSYINSTSNPTVFYGYRSHIETAIKWMPYYVFPSNYHIKYWNWSINENGTWDNDTTMNASHIFTHNGTFTVNLFVKDNWGKRHNQSFQFIVSSWWRNDTIRIEPIFFFNGNNITLNSYNNAFDTKYRYYNITSKCKMSLMTNGTFYKEKYCNWSRYELADAWTYLVNFTPFIPNYTGFFFNITSSVDYLKIHIRNITSFTSPAQLYFRNNSVYYNGSSWFNNSYSVNSASLDYLDNVPSNNHLYPYGNYNNTYIGFGVNITFDNPFIDHNWSYMRLNETVNSSQRYNGWWTGLYREMGYYGNIDWIKCTPIFTVNGVRYNNKSIENWTAGNCSTGHDFNISALCNLTLYHEGAYVSYLECFFDTASLIENWTQLANTSRYINRSFPFQDDVFYLTVYNCSNGAISTFHFDFSDDIWVNLTEISYFGTDTVGWNNFTVYNNTHYIICGEIHGIEINGYAMLEQANDTLNDTLNDLRTDIYGWIDGHYRGWLYQPGEVPGGGRYPEHIPFREKTWFINEAKRWLKGVGEMPFWMIVSLIVSMITLFVVFTGSFGGRRRR